MSPRRPADEAAAPAPVPARIATALATAAAVWCLGAAHLLSPQAAAIIVGLLIGAEALAQWRPVHTRRIVLPLALLTFGFVAVNSAEKVKAASVSNARPLGAFITAGALVVVALAGSRRRDLLARLGLLVAATGLALTAGARASMIPAVAVGLLCGATLVALERAALTAAPAATRSRRPPPPLVRTRLIATPLAVTVALTAFVAADATLPKHHQSAVGDAAAGEASSGDASSADTSSGDTGSAQAQTRLDPASGIMDLRQRGGLSHKPVARIQPIGGDSSPHLWRAAVMEGYDGSRWYPVEKPEPVTDSGGRLIDVVRPLSSQALPLLTPGTASTLILSDASYDDPAWPQTIAGGWYQVDSIVPVSTAAQLAVTPKTAGEDEDPVPAPAVPARVAALGRQLTAQATNRADAVSAVVSYLHAHETYKLSSPVPAKGTDAVDNFLFTSHTGFCEQFASAAAVLLQAADIPTRVVVGYASGQQQQDGSWLLRGSDAHAWIEVYYPRAGWLPVDPTAGVTLAPGGSQRDWRPLAIGASLVLLAAVGALITLGMRRRRARRADPLRHSLHVLDSALGSARRQPTESLRDLGARLPLTPTETAALRAAESAFYGPSPMAGNTETSVHTSAAAATIRRAARRIRRERVIPRRRQPRH